MQGHIEIQGKYEDIVKSDSEIAKSICSNPNEIQTKGRKRGKSETEGNELISAASEVNKVDKSFISEIEIYNYLKC